MVWICVLSTRAHQAALIAAGSSGPVDEVGTTYVQSMRLMGFGQTMTMGIVKVEPQRLIHEHSGDGPMDNYFRFEPDGDATNLVVESDYELPGKLPGFIKDLMATSWMERQMRQMLADFKALAEAKVPAKA
jgi:uncharacterized membrane protein